MVSAPLSFLVLLAALCASADEIPLPKSATNLNANWKWLREDRSAWRITNGFLEVRVQPGNMWGPANDARNVLLIPLPRSSGLEITATIEHSPTNQYEQGGPRVVLHRQQHGEAWAGAR
jgi:hypothetical protein